MTKTDNPIKIINHPKNDGRTATHIKGIIPGDIHHVAVWRMPDGEKKVIGVSMFDEKTNARNPEAFKPHPAAKLLMKLHKRDVVRLLHKGEEKTAKITSLKPANGQMVLIEHFEAGNIVERQKEEKIQIFLSFNKIIEQKVRKLYIDPTGKVYDPGPHIDKTEAT